MAETRKEVKLRLTVEADMKGGQEAARKLGADIEKVGKNADEAKRKLAGMGGPGGGGGGAGGPSGGPGLGQNISAIGAFAGKVAIVSAGVAAVANFSKALYDFENPAKNARDKFVGLAEAVPLVGGALGNLTNNLLDMIERMRDPEGARRLDALKASQSRVVGEGQVKTEGWQRIDDLRRETRDAESASRGFDMVPGQAQAGTALAGFGGVAAVESVDPRMQAALDDVRKAQRAFAVSDEQAKNQQVDTENARLAADQAKTEADAAAAKSRAAVAAAGVEQQKAEAPRKSIWADDPFNIRGGNENEKNVWNDDPAGMKKALQQNPAQEALLEEQRKIQAALQAQAAAEKEMTANKQKMLDLEQKRYALMQAETNLKRAQLSLLDEEAAKVKAGSQQFGAMDTGYQSGLLDALKRFKEGGRESVTEGEFAALQQNELSRGLVAKRVEEDLSIDPTYQQFLKETGARDLKVIEKEQVKLRQEIQVKVELDEQQYQKLLAEGLKKANNELEAGLLKIVELRFGELKRQENSGRVSRGQ